MKRLFFLFAARKWKISMLSNMGVPLAKNRRCRFGPKKERNRKL